MRTDVLFLPLQAVRANLRLATCVWIEAGVDGLGRQSQIGASLLAWLFHSVFPCLRGESFVPWVARTEPTVPNGVHATSRSRLMQHAIVQNIMPRRCAQLVHSFRGGARIICTRRRN